MGALQPQNLHRNGAAKQTNRTTPLTSAVETLSALIVARVGGFLDVVVVEYETSGTGGTLAARSNCDRTGSPDKTCLIRLA